MQVSIDAVARQNGTKVSTGQSGVKQLVGIARTSMIIHLILCIRRCDAYLARCMQVRKEMRACARMFFAEFHKCIHEEEEHLFSLSSYMNHVYHTEFM